MQLPASSSFFFFFNDTATTEIYTLSLHDALPIFNALRLRLTTGEEVHRGDASAQDIVDMVFKRAGVTGQDRKSTRLNSSHQIISYAVFCLKKKKIARRPSTDSIPDTHTSASTWFS